MHAAAAIMAWDLLGSNHQSGSPDSSRPILQLLEACTAATQLRGSTGQGSAHVQTNEADAHPRRQHS